MFSQRTCLPTLAPIMLLTLVGLAALAARPAAACTTIMVGRQATQDGSVLMGSSCDGDLMGLIYIVPAQSFPAGTRRPMYWNLPRPKTDQQYLANVRKGYDVVGFLPVTKTYRSIILAGNVESMTTGGLNEHGLSIAIEFLPMRPGLACDKGTVGPNSNHWTTSLIANGLMRSKTAREAIRLIGSMVEQYGFLYYRAPNAGVALPISDGQETWLMEIFGPGPAWTAGSGKPGGVWCAQRIPDGEVGCSANRSRIGKVNLDDPDHFMASPNIFSLAQDLGLWNGEGPFVWYRVYGGPGSRANCLREWRALSLAAPSLGLRATGDAEVDRYPFSVKPRRSIGTETLMHIMRDSYEDTPFDRTQDPAFQVDGRMSPLARPWGPIGLFDLLHVKPERTIATPSSGYVFIAQLRDSMPDAIGSCLWFAYGPASTSCFLPIYAGVTDLPDRWDRPANFTRIDRQQAQWNFRLVHNLSCRLRYQDAIQDVHRVVRPAEAKFLGLQTELEKTAADVYRRLGPRCAERLVTNYARQCTTQVGHAYLQLVDYLTLKYLVDFGPVAAPPLPRITPPVIPDAPSE